MRLFQLAAGFGAAALIATTAVVLAQPANPLVTPESATHTATLTGAEEVPPVQTTASGNAWVLFDPQTNTLSWTVEFSGLSGPATGAHFHGPADVGATAGVVVSLVADPAAGFASPIQGTATITAEQAAQFTGGMWYVNVHTAANPAGEIRGQVVVKAAAAGGLAPLTFTAQQVSQGRSIFTDNCAGCHGEDLRGLDGGPRLVGSAFPRWFEGPVSALHEFILTRMPADRPGSLNPRQATALVAFIAEANGLTPGDTALPEDAAALATMGFTQ
jgi:mono/diheme cytochrome c family protein